MVTEEKLEERQKSAAFGYEKLLEHTTELAHLVDSHSKTGYTGDLETDNIFLEDEKIRSRAEQLLPELQHYRANTYIQLKNVERRLENSPCKHVATRTNNDTVQTFFESTEAEVYDLLNQTSLFLPEAKRYMENTPLVLDYCSESFTDAEDSARELGSRLPEEFQQG